MATHFPTVTVDTALRGSFLPDQDTPRPLALVVDDDPVITATLAAILDSIGVAPIIAHDARQALETAEVIPPEILISDATLPDRDGFNLALDVARASADCAVILFCNPELAFDSATGVESLGTAVRILIKPVHPIDLLKAVSDLLARREGPLDRFHSLRGNQPREAALPV